MRIILANGCFDVLHPGHVEHLQEAKMLGGLLVVGLTLDAFVNKPGRPIQPWHERAAMLMSLACVDGVVPCENAVQAIRLLRPAYFVKGRDYSGGILGDEEKACWDIGAQPHYTGSLKRSTTELIKRIKEAA